MARLTHHAVVRPQGQRQAVAPRDCNGAVRVERGAVDCRFIETHEWSVRRVLAISTMYSDGTKTQTPTQAFPMMNDHKRNKHRPVRRPPPAVGPDVGLMVLIVGAL